MAESLLSRFRSFVHNAGPRATRPEAWRKQLSDCAEARGGEVSARTRAAALAQTYLGLDDAGRRQFLRMIAAEFGPDPQRVALASEAYQRAVGTPGQWDAEAQLRQAMRSSRIRILTQFNAIPQGVKFLVDLRADLSRLGDGDPALAALDRELESRLVAWFDIGFLELQRLTWQTPAAILEKLIEYEAVHEIRSWSDLKNRLDSDRRLYAFFHPRMPAEPLIFVEVALTDQLAGNIQTLLDEAAPVFDARRADTAIFYSISNTQPGLRGVSFGNFLLKRVIDDLRRDLPRLKHFATLSPLPGLARWAGQHPEALAECGLAATDWLPDATWAQDKTRQRALRQPLLRLAARYLLEARNAAGTQPADAVARFHLGNGARVERLNFLADSSAKGLAQSYGLMVNYRYELDALEHNVEDFITSGRIAASADVRRLVRRPREADPH